MLRKGVARQQPSGFFHGLTVVQEAVQERRQRPSLCKGNAVRSLHLVDQLLMFQPNHMLGTRALGLPEVGHQFIRRTDGAVHCALKIERQVTVLCWGAPFTAPA